ncbi:MAG: HAD family hydrolase [Candidatus Omnitrophica bacterium]|nr:HAD family hydrolase [Candidatus Omnitrophota bacterium]
MKNIKLVIFDLDGTLVDASLAIVSSFNYTMRKLGYPARGRLSIIRAVGWGDENLLRPFVKKEDLKKAVLLYRQHHKKALLKGSHLFPKVGTLLAYLKNKGYKLAVASNRPTRFSWILIRHLKLTKYFDYVLCADKLKKGKPHPEIINRAMKKLSVRPQETVYVGDMAIDVQAGRRAKVRAIIVTTGVSTKKEIIKERPYRIIGKIRELLHLL